MEHTATQRAPANMDDRLTFVTVRVYLSGIMSAQPSGGYDCPLPTLPIARPTQVRDTTALKVERLGSVGPRARRADGWPRFPPSFWGFEGVLEMLPETAMTPPLGLITVAALCPPSVEDPPYRPCFEEIRDEDLLGRIWSWSAPCTRSALMRVRTSSSRRALGRRTFVGGPWASSDPERRPRVRRSRHRRRSRRSLRRHRRATSSREPRTRLYRVVEKPDMTASPIPRFDLLRLDKYTSMPVQFSRGCPFQCEFCDIITIYGRKPRTKSPAQLIAELDTLRALGWRNEVFIVDDNFIGNSTRRSPFPASSPRGRRSTNHPFSFYTEASSTSPTSLSCSMPWSPPNFMYVFIGIETPSEASCAKP